MIWSCLVKQSINVFSTVPGGDFVEAGDDSAGNLGHWHRVEYVFSLLTQVGARYGQQGAALQQARERLNLRKIRINFILKVCFKGSLKKITHKIIDFPEHLLCWIMCQNKEVREEVLTELMTGAGHVSCTGSPQESEYKQLAWAPPHHTQPYFWSAVWQRLQSERPTEQLYRVTEDTEGINQCSNRVAISVGKSLLWR